MFDKFFMFHKSERFFRERIVQANHAGFFANTTEQRTGERIISADNTAGNDLRHCQLRSGSELFKLFLLKFVL